MERRHVMKIAGLALGGTAVAAPALAQKSKTASPASPSDRKDFTVLAEVSDDCLRACRICIVHCQSLLAQGDTMLGDCLKRCLELVPLCEATGALASYGSALTPKTAKVCLEACQACAESCKPHIGHHAPCKACYEACLKRVEACKAA
jgi:Cys-rich four helix bundle protein (predicted Tat secretion target)